MAQHDADTLLFKMANSPYGIRFFRRQGHDPQRLPGASNQRIQLGDIQFAEQLRRMSTFILWREIGAFKIAPQYQGAGAAGKRAPGDTFQRTVDGLQRRGDGSREPGPHSLASFIHRQPVECFRCLVHHINTRAAVDMRIDVGRAKQIGIASGDANGNGLDGGDNASFHTKLMIGKPALLG